jgi:hypothetical protein
MVSDQTEGAVEPQALTWGDTELIGSNMVDLNPDYQVRQNPQCS